MQSMEYFASIKRKEGNLYILPGKAAKGKSKVGSAVCVWDGSIYAHKAL